MIGYTLVGTNDLERAKSFYDALFGEIGVGRMMEMGVDVRLGRQHGQAGLRRHSAL